MYDKHAEQVREFYQHILERSESELSEWLFYGFSTDDFEPVDFFDRPSTIVQFQRLVASVDVHLQRKIKHALLLALSKWSLSANSPVLFIDLVQLAALIKCPEVLHHIRLLYSDRVLESLDEDQYLDIMQDLIAVVAGFAPLIESKALLEELYTSPQIDARFAGQLFLGLCACAPNDYHLHVGRFMELFKRAKKDLRLDIIFAELVRIVSLRTIAMHFSSIDTYHQTEFINYLTTKEWSPAIVLYFDENLIALRANPLYEALGPDYMNDAQYFPIGEDRRHFLSPAARSQWNYELLTSKWRATKNPVRYLASIASRLTRAPNIPGTAEFQL